MTWPVGSCLLPARQAPYPLLKYTHIACHSAWPVCQMVLVAVSLQCIQGVGVYARCSSRQSLCGGHGNVNECRRSNETFASYCHKGICTPTYLVVEDAMVIKSGESVAWLAKLWGLQLYGASLPTLSFVHLTAALQPLKAAIPEQIHERSYKCAACSKQGMYC